MERGEESRVAGHFRLACWIVFVQKAHPTTSRGIRAKRLGRTDGRTLEGRHGRLAELCFCFFPHLFDLLVCFWPATRLLLLCRVSGCSSLSILNTVFPVSLLLVSSCVIRDICLVWCRASDHAQCHRPAKICLHGAASRPPPDRRLNEFTALPAQNPRLLRPTVDTVG